jgi:ubiquinone/menaquinone biosynthesis C-methylase UbiE
MKKSPVEKHFDVVAKNYDYGKSKYSYYYENLKKLLGSIIPKGKKVFEVGCGTGDLLNHLQPKYGYGFDISDNMIEISKIKYQKPKNLHFSTSWPSEKFDYIFMSDVIEHLDNPRETFRKISKLMGKDTVFVNTMANPIWEPLLIIWEKLGLKMPEGPHSRVKIQELRIMMEESGIRVMKHDYKLLIPVKIPLVTKFANRYIERYLKRFAFIEYFVAEAG